MRARLGLNFIPQTQTLSTTPRLSQSSTLSPPLPPITPTQLLRVRKNTRAHPVVVSPVCSCVRVKFYPPQTLLKHSIKSQNCLNDVSNCALGFKPIV
jgi:hypothetical protein